MTSLIEYAPSGVSAFSGPSIGFTSAGADRLGFKARIPLCSLAAPGTSTLGYITDALPGMLMVGNTLSFTGPSVMSTIALSPVVHAGVTAFNNTTPAWQTFAAFADCNFIGLLSQPFSKYLIKRLKVTYMPTTTTIDPTNFSLVFTDDPEHMVIGMGGYTTTNGVPTYTTAKNSVNSVNFACWSTWEREFKIDPTTVYYTGATIRTDIGTAAVSALPPFASSELRLSHFGALSVFANQTSGTSASAPKGELYLEMDGELFDMVPITAVSGLPFNMVQYIELTGQQKFISIEDDDEKKEVSRLSRPVPTLASSGHYRIIQGSAARSKRSVALTPRRLSQRSPPYQMHPLGRGNPPPKAQAVPMRAQLPRESKIGIVHVIAHLNSRKSMIPVQAHGQLKTLRSLASKKSRGWKDTAKGVVKNLVKDVPIIGGLLGELTDSVGGKLLDWIGNLF